ncbi:MAG: hydrogenase subunit MbhD domain-containing protein [Acidimicrobiales bacterium]
MILVIHAVVLPPAPQWAMTLLEVTLLSLVAAGATVVVAMRHPVRQVVLLSAYGALLTLLFFTLQAPDVALSELSVGTVVLPLLLLLGLAKVRSRRE